MQQFSAVIFSLFSIFNSELIISLKKYIYIGLAYQKPQSLSPTPAQKKLKPQKMNFKNLNCQNRDFTMVIGHTHVLIYFLIASNFNNFIFFSLVYKSIN